MARQASFPTRRKIARALFSVLFAVLAALSFAAPAQAIANLRKPAAIVVDAKTGKVLYQHDADEYRYPASITKVMTLYILFQELKAGHLHLNSLLTVSPYAAAAEPTKLGLRAGSKIRVEDAIKSIVTISANDMARAIAENISGSESAFARRMTATARELGMRHTTYVNASGLPAGDQLTTVADQAILASAMSEHFPQYYHFFQTKSFTYGKRTYGNHDRVLGYMGADGLKTGYINAEGYNLMTATRIGNRHVVVIAFGYNTGRARDAAVRSLLSRYVPKAHQGSYLASAVIPRPDGALPAVQLASVAADEGAPRVLPMPAPTIRQDNPVARPMPATTMPVAYAPEPLAYPNPSAATAGSGAAPMDIGARPALAAVSAVGAPSARADGAQPDVVGQSLNNMLLGAPPAPLGQTRPSAPLIPPVGIGDGNEPVDPLTSGSISGERVAEASFASGSPATSAPAAPAGSWLVQVGAAPSPADAKRLLARATSKVPTLNDARSYVERFDKDGRTFYRARFIGFGNERAASRMCGQLKRAEMSCLAMQG